MDIYPLKILLISKDKYPLKLIKLLAPFFRKFIFIYFLLFMSNLLKSEVWEKCKTLYVLIAFKWRIKLSKL